ncbi:uncharacterized protein LOC113271788 [Papaver somniferum]|uniref:uncharacterized protein LOC113271788 n=1 Tax=Papaver somniferum TaxID=3469 RepID=UPI000E7036BD|nr:uncharacterized protein LOC113271788 [Papaver somniferum]
MIKTAQNVSLHDLDEAITTQRKDEGIYSFLISQKVSAANIHEVVNNLVHEGLAKRKYGILQISEAQMLDFECFSLIKSALETSFLSVFLSAARGMCGFRGSEIFIPTKIPGVIFLRMIIIRAPNNEDAFGMSTLFWYSNERQKLVTPVVDRLKRKDMINCVVLLAGPLQTGKSELAYQISKKLGSEDLFFPMIESDEYPVAELKKILKDTIRRAVSLKMRQNKKVYEGEVVEISSKATGSSSGINWQTTCDIVIGLKTDAKEQHFELGEQLSKAIIKEQVAIGDVICIDFCNQVVTRIGRSPTFSEEKDHAKNVYVALPKGEILKEEKIQDITIYDLYKTERRGHSICKLVRKEMNPKESRSGDAINKAIESLVKQKVIQPQRGVLFIDQVDSLDEKILSFICKIMKYSENVFPVLMFSTEKDISELSLTGMPKNILEHMVIVHTQACGLPENSIKELEPRTLCTVPALEKEVKFIDAFQLVSASFGAGAIASIVLAAANSDTPPHTFGFLIGAFVCCNSSLLHYLHVAFDLQSSIKEAKDSKSTKEIWIDRSKVKVLRRQVLLGFFAGTWGVGWVIASLVAYILRKFNNPTLMFVALLVVLGGSYVWFVKKIWKQLTAMWCCEEQRTL